MATDDQDLDSLFKFTFDFDKLKCTLSKIIYEQSESKEKLKEINTWKTLKS